MKAPSKQRQDDLRAWLAAHQGAFATELQMTTAATQDVGATGTELDWMALAWRLEGGDAMEQDAGPAGGVEGSGGQTAASEAGPNRDAAIGDTGQVVGLTAGPASPPAVREATPMDTLARLGQWLAYAESDSTDMKAKGAAAALRLYYAQELGLSPLAASELSVIKGRLVVGAKLLRARALEAGYRVVPRDASDTACTAVLVDKRTGEELGTCTYTIEMAKRAGLVKERSAWVTHPQRMLWARSAKFLLDDYAPQVTLGLLTEDEAAEVAGRPAQPADGDDPSAVREPAPGDVVEGEVSEDDIVQGTIEAEDADYWPADHEPPPPPEGSA